MTKKQDAERDETWSAQKPFVQSSTLHSAIWASCIIGVTALIGGFFGAPGFRDIGIGLAVLSICTALGLGTRPSRA